MTIPLFASRGALEPLLPEIAERQRAVLESGRYILGPEVEAFESEFAAYVGSEHCVGLANGTDAIEIGLRALGVAPGDEVVVPAFTFFATAEAVVAMGATPVFCDVDPATWCMTPATAEPVITEQTRALIPVHIFGNPAPVPELLELAQSRGIRVLEDAAQAHGAELDGRLAGALGHAAAFSFFPSKNLGGFGDGGALTTDDSEVAEAARLLRTRGSKDKRTFTQVGFNSRLDELQAAALRVLLPHLPDWIEARRRAAAAYLEAGLGGLARIQSETEGARSAWHILAIASEARDRLAEALGDAGIGARPYYETPLYRQPALERWAPAKPLAETERICSGILALPMGAALPDDAPAEVIAAIRSAGSRSGRGGRPFGASPTR
ncbi:MAG TPA: DegT/DnrJ/EryC1/StrS family aminotransferase [Solirubrobacterales bacterium]|nr:DegT/DnrJ/EryC1/StrS family aminotransferase [Solirubrobacterales bacterium]